MTNSTWTQRLGLAVILALGGCGPQVRITEPANGSTVDTLSIVAQMEFDAPARSFHVVLDDTDESAHFFLTDSQAAGKISIPGDGEHVLSVDYLSESGFEDSTQSIFTANLPDSLVSISVIPLTDTLKVNDPTNGSVGLNVTGHYTSSPDKDLTADPNTVYSSSDEAIAKVNHNGKVTAVLASTTPVTITITNGSATATMTVTVTGP